MNPETAPTDAQGPGFPRFGALYRTYRSRHSRSMAVLDIARMGNPILRRKAEPVADPMAPGLRRLVSDMLETMDYAGGTGLAAPQVHVPVRVVIFYVEGARARLEDDPEAADGSMADDPTGDNPMAGDPMPDDPPGEGDGGVPLTVLINPEIEVVDPTPVVGMEACLSLPGLAGEVSRHAAVRYHGLTLDGTEVVREAHGFHARVVQHECDHLDGILFPQRMTDLSRLTFASELERLARRRPAEV
jgi:peptide deformylase